MEQDLRFKFEIINLVSKCFIFYKEIKKDFLAIEYQNLKITLFLFAQIFQVVHFSIRHIAIFLQFYSILLKA